MYADSKNIMKRQSSSRMLCLAMLAASALALPVQAAEPKPADSIQAFYFGNSLLENSVPWFQPSLFKTAGREMKVRTQIGPGRKIWMHVDKSYTEPYRARKTLVEGDWKLPWSINLGNTRC